MNPKCTNSYRVLKISWKYRKYLCSSQIMLFSCTYKRIQSSKRAIVQWSRYCNIIKTYLLTRRLLIWNCIFRTSIPFLVKLIRPRLFYQKFTKVIISILMCVRTWRHRINRHNNNNSKNKKSWINKQYSSTTKQLNKQL